jgi:hypothetical protein
MTLEQHYRIEEALGVPRSSSNKRRNILKSFRMWRLVAMWDTSVANL